MKNTINLKDLKKIKGENKVKRTYYDRLNDAVESGFSFKLDDFYKVNSKLVFEFNDVALISLNDLLRINFKSCYKYIKLWKERVINIVDKNKIENYPFGDDRVKIEFIIETKNNQTLDYDASIACTKFITDGLVKSKIIKDDSLKYLPMIISKQKKSTNGISSIKMVLSKITESELDSFFSEI
jgi:hypothetical protein